LGRVVCRNSATFEGLRRDNSCVDICSVAFHEVHGAIT
jgi:hypothetical protein